MKKIDGKQEFYDGAVRGVMLPLEILAGIFGVDRRTSPHEEARLQRNSNEHYLGILFGVVVDIGIGWTLSAQIGEWLGRSI